jgi:hypothetical protein
VALHFDHVLKGAFFAAGLKYFSRDRIGSVVGETGDGANSVASGFTPDADAEFSLDWVVTLNDSRSH